jgi:hypothetical protein
MLLLSTAYLPPVSYMAECLRAEEVRIEAFETYAKQSYRNRFSIAGPNGRQDLSIPVIRVNGNHTLVKDIRIAYIFPWQKNHWRSIRTAYSNSPFFLFYQDYFIPFYEKKIPFLLDLNLQILETLLRMLRIEKKISATEIFEKTPVDVTDRRNFLVSKHHRREIEPYPQVFRTRYPFLCDLSIIDLIFNLGPDSVEYLKQPE